MRTPARLTVLAVLVLLPVAGCGSSAGPGPSSVVPARGKVTYKGQPLTQGDISFEPTDIGRPANGSIQADGTFVLTTFKQGDGAVAGTHRVSVTGNNKVPAKYRNSSSSKTEVEVKAGTSEYPVDFK
jgi:hypothetical protein